MSKAKFKAAVRKCKKARKGGYHACMSKALSGSGKRRRRRRR